MQSFQQYFSSTTYEQRIAAALVALRLGKAVAVLDDENRENEGDLIVAAELVDTPTMTRLIRDCTGIVCLCLPAEAVDALGLPPMAKQNGSRFGTAFTVSIEAREGVSTGVSAADRVTTTRAALTGDPSRIVSPGHLFPIRGEAGGVLARRGHTEASVDLMRLAGLQAAALLCELMHDDGSMMRGEAVVAYAAERGVPVLTIEDIVRYRLATEAVVA
ncbi:MAG: 3,4-dihydroxy-2-butanone-4-phosphate synthase [Burkholderiales bacterium]|nr:3,4-dihydroxy-2-butanone-4-phosphate synthase [Burkholderiales bacterium]